jgi:hypothetical protein
MAQLWKLLPTLCLGACAALQAPPADAGSTLTDFAPPGTTDFSAAFRRAIAAAQPGGVVLVPKGEFPIGSTVAVTGAVRVVGVGAASQLIWKGRVDQTLLSFDASAGQSAEDLALRGNQGIGVQVQGPLDHRGPLLKSLTIQGFDTGIQVRGTFDGQIENTRLTSNRSGLSMDQAESWIAQALWIDDSLIALKTSRTKGFRLLGGRIARAGTRGLQIDGCVGCTFDSLRFDLNAEDIALGSGDDNVSTVAFIRSTGARKIQVTNRSPCTVDGLSFRDFGGPSEATVDSACPVHLWLEQAEVTVTRQNSFGTQGLPEVFVFQGGQTFRVTSDGRTLVGSDHGDAALTIAATGKALDLVNGAAARDTQNTLPPGQQTSRSVALRFTDDKHQAKAEVRCESEQPGAGLALRAGGNEVMRIANTGRVGIGTTTPATRLAVEGDARIDGVLSTQSIIIPSGKADDPCRTPGQLQVVPAASKGDSDLLRACRADGTWQVVDLGAP